MRIVTWNVNGLRSVVRRDFDRWLQESAFDLVCLQEVKVEEDLLTANWFGGYRAFWNSARRPGHSGVATLVREDHVPTLIRKGMAHEPSDAEGRVLTVDVNGLRVVNVYAPHSHRALIRLGAKLNFLSALSAFLKREVMDGVPLVLVGDLNIAHGENDLANPKSNVKNAGFLPQERDWLDSLIKDGFIDAFRQFELGPGHYTWWSMRQGVRQRNVGWRLDYAWVATSLRHRLVSCRHMPDRTGSDHCPVIVEIS
jgi:exodeoxyribonuclease III